MHVFIILCMYLLLFYKHTRSSNNSRDNFAPRILMNITCYIPFNGSLPNCQQFEADFATFEEIVTFWEEYQIKQIVKAAFRLQLGQCQMPARLNNSQFEYLNNIVYPQYEYLNNIVYSQFEYLNNIVVSMIVTVMNILHQSKQCKMVCLGVLKTGSQEDDVILNSEAVFTTTSRTGILCGLSCMAYNTFLVLY